ncbi:PIN domain-containing protein [Algoriphagus aquimarinus]|uniref:Type II toxin-antitoxin system VapC family toxin n=1 Tax=Algoriphagus aquimarinus TaxID=237018 RepID=A0A5C7AK72_9BACT|nr:PIN domain-containing protein [Algoriphagus aquimarinus]TXE08841.1 type II toxin-antitoxin system VapC family toxin [Algoriphagus aquimarinus]
MVWGRVEEEVDVFHKFISGSTVFLIDQKIIDKTIEIRRVLKIKIPDAIIAATAIVNNLVLISYNDKDFLKMSGMGLNYLNPKNLL